MKQTKLYAFVMGIIEFNSDYTLNFGEESELQEIYEKGRYMMQKIMYKEV